jgi:uncharacterized protein (DUF1330 family)
MAKAYWVATYRSISDADKLAAYAKARGAGDPGGGRKVSGARQSGRRTYEAGLNQRCVVIEFDSVAAATAAHDSAGLQGGTRRARQRAERDIRIMEGA